MVAVVNDSATVRRRKTDLPWRKCYPHWWDQPHVERFTVVQKLIWAFLLFGPHTNRIGYYRLRLPHAALSLGIPEAELRDNLSVVLAACRWRYDPQTDLVWNPFFFADDPPSNPDHVRGLVKDLRRIPRSTLDQLFRDHTRILKPAIVDVFREAVQREIDGLTTADDDDTPCPTRWRPGVGHQEQEQSQEPFQEHTQGAQQPDDCALVPTNADDERFDGDADPLDAAANELRDLYSLLFRLKTGAVPNLSNRQLVQFRDLLRRHELPLLRKALAVFFLQPDDWLRRNAWPVAAFVSQFNTFLAKASEMTEGQYLYVLNSLEEGIDPGGGDRNHWSYC